MAVTPAQNPAAAVSNSFRFLVPVVVANLVQIVTLPVLTRLIPAEDFGAWALASAYALTIGGCATLGLSSVYERNFFQYSEPRARAALLYSVVACAAAGWLVTGMVTWWWRAPVANWLIGTNHHQGVLLVAFAGGAATSLKDFFMTYLRSDEDAGGFAIYSIADKVLTGVFQVVLVAGFHLGIQGVVLGQLAASGGVLLVLFARFSRRLPWAFAWAPLADSLKLGLPILPRVLVASLSSNIDKYLIGHLASLGAAGVYAIGQRVANIAFVYQDAINFVYRPKVYQMMFHGGDTAPRDIGRYLTPFAYVSTLCAFAIAVFSEEAIRVLAPGGFYVAIGVATVLSLHYGSLFFGKMPQIFYARKTYWVPILTFGATIVNGAFVAVGIAWFGPIGAAWGTLAAGALNSTATYLVGQHCYRIDWEGRRMTAIFATFALSGLLTLALRSLGTPYLLLLAAKVAIAGGYLWLGHWLGIVTPANLGMVRDVIVGFVRQAGRLGRVAEGGVRD
ncbi:MAG: lipopolysaccharide biosynthesis protein [Acidobacteria bacterium]|nr:MAG: lipopolysaccharide biosynthesis protein [Acidobacteriota bacterium]